MCGNAFCLAHRLAASVGDSDTCHSRAPASLTRLHVRAHSILPGRTALQERRALCPRSCIGSLVSVLLLSQTCPTAPAVAGSPLAYHNVPRGGLDAPSRVFEVAPDEQAGLPFDHERPDIEERPAEASGRPRSQRSQGKQQAFTSVARARPDGVCQRSDVVEQRRLSGCLP